MGLDNTQVIDAVGLEEMSNSVVLNILDSWGWEEERPHLVALQEKLNSYLEFIESGQIYESYPSSRGRKLRIDVIGRFPLPDSCIRFLEKANDVASELDVEVRNRHVP